MKQAQGRMGVAVAGPDRSSALQKKWTGNPAQEVMQVCDGAGPLLSLRRS